MRSALTEKSSNGLQVTREHAPSKFLLLSTSLLVDRVFMYTGLVDTLAEAGEVSIWASSFDPANTESNWERVSAEILPFPEIRAFREYPHNFLRRFNEFVWDYRYRLESRMSMRKHVRDKQTPLNIRALKTPARLFATLGTETVVEGGLEKLLLSYRRSEEAETRLKQNRPDVIVSTGPYQFEQPGIFAVARRLGIPTVAYIPSWDNITTKNRMVFKYDGYIVWNEQMKQELHHFYPYTRDVPVYVTGAPQFDIFHQGRFFTSREDFCREQQLDPNRPIIAYAIGSPNFLKEHHGALHLAKRVVEGHLGDVQLIVRPHPIHDNAEMQELFRPFAPRVRLQKTLNAGKELTKRSQDEKQIVEWVNTFRHADVVVNLSSTVAIDAAIFDTPVVNLDFDPQPGRPDQDLIKDINHRWAHFKPVAESGGIWMVDDFDQLENAIKTYLKNPGLHREERVRIVKFVCGFSDGACGTRMAGVLKSFVGGRR